jgi:hypothetical protein
MQVRMKVTLSGTRDGEGWPPRGELVDLPDDEAQHMVRAGLAELPDEPEPAEPEARETPPIEEATAPKAETSTPSRRKSPAK